MLNSLAADSLVVISAPASFVRQFVSDTRILYAGYESLVNASARTAANPLNDRQRRVVGEFFFPGYADEIRYGVLSLDGRGLPTYGDVVLQLKSVAVSDRTTFSEQNTYVLAERELVRLDKPPKPGHRSVWDNRTALITAKLAPSLGKGYRGEQIAALAVQSGSGERAHDEFIEAHIFGPLSAHSIARIEESGRRLDRAARFDLRIARERFAQLER